LDKEEDVILQRLRKAEVIFLGGSAGSFTPIFNIVRALSESFKQTIVVIIHRGKNNFSDIENLFAANCRISVCGIMDKDKIISGRIYIAPANYHTLIEKNKTFALDVSDPVWYSKPSIDVTFDSAARTYGAKCAAILFSGANQDGADGLLKLHNKGALTIVQSAEDAEISTMPQAAIDANAAEYILKADQILNLLRSDSQT